MVEWSKAGCTICIHYINVLGMRKIEFRRSVSTFVWKEKKKHFDTFDDGDLNPPFYLSSAILSYENDNLDCAATETGVDSVKRVTYISDPEMWPETFPTCGGQSQSPIKIHPQDAKPVKFGRLDYNKYWVNLNNNLALLTNTGYSVEIVLNRTEGEEPYLTGGPLPPDTVYKLAQIHFHWGKSNIRGSEHVIVPFDEYNTKQPIHEAVNMLSYLSSEYNTKQPIYEAVNMLSYLSSEYNTKQPIYEAVNMLSYLSSEYNTKQPIYEAVNMLSYLSSEYNTKQPIYEAVNMLSYLSSEYNTKQPIYEAVNMLSYLSSEYNTKQPIYEAVNMLSYLSSEYNTKQPIYEAVNMLSYLSSEYNTKQPIYEAVNMLSYLSSEYNTKQPIYEAVNMLSYLSSEYNTKQPIYEAVNMLSYLSSEYNTKQPIYEAVNMLSYLSSEYNTKQPIYEAVNMLSYLSSEYNTKQPIYEAVNMLSYLSSEYNTKQPIYEAVNMLSYLSSEYNTKQPIYEAVNMLSYLSSEYNTKQPIYEAVNMLSYLSSEYNTKQPIYEAVNMLSYLSSEYNTKQPIYEAVNMLSYLSSEYNTKQPIYEAVNMLSYLSSEYNTKQPIYEAVNMLSYLSSEYNTKQPIYEAVNMLSYLSSEYNTKQPIYEAVNMLSYLSSEYNTKQPIYEAVNMLSYLSSEYNTKQPIYEAVNMLSYLSSEYNTKQPIYETENKSALEAHLVHYNSKYKSLERALGKLDGVAIVAILFMVSHLLGVAIATFLFMTPMFTEYRETSEVLKNLTDTLYKVTEPETAAWLDESVAINWLDKDIIKKVYFTYMGSLTTPPCDENVTWIVYNQHMEVGAFRQLRTTLNNELSTNIRAAQDVNNRPLFLSDPSAEETLSSLLEGLGASEANRDSNGPENTTPTTSSVEPPTSYQELGASHTQGEPEQISFGPLNSTTMSITPSPAEEPAGNSSQNPGLYVCVLSTLYGPDSLYPACPIFITPLPTPCRKVIGGKSPVPTLMSTGVSYCYPAIYLAIPVKQYLDKLLTIRKVEFRGSVPIFAWMESGKPPSVQPSGIKTPIYLSLTVWSAASDGLGHAARRYNNVRIACGRSDGKVSFIPLCNVMAVPRCAPSRRDSIRCRRPRNESLETTELVTAGIQALTSPPAVPLITKYHQEHVLSLGLLSEDPAATERAVCASTSPASCDRRNLLRALLQYLLLEGLGQAERCQQSEECSVFHSAHRSFRERQHRHPLFREFVVSVVSFFR
uniref:carbonic anhydrase n=1 Tax=Timema poppense TaxID=170557 RepID=A0A7R9DBP8_TIMPO|nr:unnamed protein product [Timema poppensis]